MGLFDDFNSDAKVNQRADDKEGVYWQRINKVREEETSVGDCIKIHKTTVRIISVPERSPGNMVGEDTSQVIWPNKKKIYNYFERDCKKLCQVALGLTDDEANSLTGKQIKELFNEDTLAGQVIEISVREVVDKNDSSKTYLRHTLRRHVPAKEVEECVDEDTRQALGLVAAS